MSDQEYQRPSAAAIVERGHEREAAPLNGTALLDAELEGVAGGRSIGEEIPM